MQQTGFTAWLEKMQLDMPDAARKLGVSIGTVRNYCSGFTHPPYCTRVVMRLLAGGDDPINNPWPE